MAGRSGMRPGWIMIAATLIVLVAAGASYVAVNAGGDDAPAVPGPTTTPEASTTPISLGPATDCLGRQHQHLNIESLQRLSESSMMAISEIDEDEVLLEVDGARFIVYGWGEDVGILEPSDVSDQVSSQIVRAVDAVRYEC